MAKIQKVNYQDLATQSKNIRQEANTLEKQLQDAYTKVGNMHSDWYGKRYNELVKGFNKIVTDVNEMIKLVTADIPDNLDTIAYNYSQADTDSSVSRPQKTTPGKVTALTESSDVGMKFITTSVESTKTQVENCFKNANSQMDTIDSLFKKVEWVSEAADAFTKKFNTLKNNLCKSFGNLEKDFRKLMQQTIDDIEKAENANTIS